MNVLLREENFLAGPDLRGSKQAIALGPLQNKNRIHRSY
jgi:hypothetical protein